VPGNDFGTEIEILDGLKGDERVVSNPGEQLTEGIPVMPEAEKEDGEAPDNKGKQGQDSPKDSH
jgi:hypothetical protein